MLWFWHTTQRSSWLSARARDSRTPSRSTSSGRTVGMAWSRQPRNHGKARQHCQVNCALSHHCSLRKGFQQRLELFTPDFICQRTRIAVPNPAYVIDDEVSGTPVTPSSMPVRPDSSRPTRQHRDSCARRASGRRRRACPSFSPVDRNRLVLRKLEKHRMFDAASGTQDAKTLSRVTWPLRSETRKTVATGIDRSQAERRGRPVNQCRRQRAMIRVQADRKSRNQRNHHRDRNEIMKAQQVALLLGGNSGERLKRPLRRADTEACDRQATRTRPTPLSEPDPDQGHEWMVIEPHRPGSLAVGHRPTSRTDSRSGLSGYRRP